MSLSTPAGAGGKIALLIGNGDYQHTTSLQNPANDVRHFGELLRSLGFDVVVHTDLTLRAFNQALLQFSSRARGADTALIFYSGHGMELGGANYLIPIDAKLSVPGSERFEALALNTALAAVAGATRLSIVIVDACRNGAPGGSRSRGRGFMAVVPDRPGTVIAFSTAAGAVAWDGAGRLSPYTRALSEELARDPDADVRILLTSLGNKTTLYARGEQRPFARFGDMPRTTVSLAGPRAANNRPVTLKQPNAPDAGNAPIIVLRSGKCSPISANFTRPFRIEVGSSLCAREEPHNMIQFKTVQVSGVRYANGSYGTNTCRIGQTCGVHWGGRIRFRVVTKGQRKGQALIVPAQ